MARRTARVVVVLLRPPDRAMRRVSVSGVVVVVVFLFALLLALLFAICSARAAAGVGGGVGCACGGRHAPSSSTSIIPEMRAVSGSIGMSVYGMVVWTTLVAAFIIQRASLFCAFFWRAANRAVTVHTRAE